MIIENVVLIDKWLLINSDNKGNWKYFFLVEGKMHSISEAEQLYQKYCDQPERSKREDNNFPKLTCKRCKSVYTQTRPCYEGKITCPLCLEIIDAVL